MISRFSFALSIVSSLPLAATFMELNEKGAPWRAVHIRSRRAHEVCGTSELQQLFISHASKAFANFLSRGSSFLENLCIAGAAMILACKLRLNGRANPGGRNPGHILGYLATTTSLRSEA
jgi:hypothetical protein